MPSPQIPSSERHALEHPSKSRALPSSHSSVGLSRRELPQRGGGISQKPLTQESPVGQSLFPLQGGFFVQRPLVQISPEGQSVFALQGEQRPSLQR